MNRPLGPAISHGGRSAKTPASKTAKEKRQAKRDKKASKAKSGLVP